MEPISKDQINEDMRGWFDEIQARKNVPSGIPQHAPITTEILHLTHEQYNEFIANPQEYVRRTTSFNAANASADPLYSR